MVVGVRIYVVHKQLCHLANHLQSAKDTNRVSRSSVVSSWNVLVIGTASSCQAPKLTVQALSLIPAWATHLIACWTCIGR